MSLPGSRRDFLAAASLAAATLAAARGSRAEPPGDLVELTLGEAIAAIAAGRIGAADYVTALAARAEAAAALNTLISARWDAAIAEAKAADARRAGGAILPLAGIAFVAKDNIDSAALPTTAGTPGLRGWQPQADAPVLARLVAAGASLAGKANMHELAFGITSNNAAFGAVRNPYAPDLIPGGSSGGTAAAVAARIVPFGLGSDTGGSCRIPAALCGCVGFRPSLGRYDQAGVVPLSSTRDTIGPLARSVADIVLLDAICAEAPAASEIVPLEGLRLGVPRGYFFDDLDPQADAIVAAALALLESAGAVLVEADLAGLAEANQAVSFPVVLFEVLRELAAYLYAHGSRMSVLDLVEQVAGPGERALLMGLLGDGAIPAAAYREALVVARPRLQALYAEHFATNEVAALLVPTTPLPARPIGEEETVELAGRRVPTFPTYIRNTDPPSNAGLPAISLPAGLTADGLPVGLELVGPAMADARLLAIAAAVEQLLPPLPPPPA